MRAQKEREKTQGTHALSSTDEETSHNTEEREKEGHLHTVEQRARDRSKHWRKERTKGTHALSSADREMSQKTERNR
jgi:hypothetical protein